VEEFPALQNPITEYLAADPDDTEMEARLKMSLEGAGVGVALEGVFNGLRAIKTVRNNKPPPEQLPSQVEPEIAKAHASTISLSTNIEGAKRAGRVAEPETIVDTLPDNLNQARIDTPDDIKDSLAEVAATHDNFSQARRGVVSHAETRRLASELGLTSDELIAKRGGDSILAHDAVAARQHLVNSAEELQELAKAAKAEPTPEKLFAFQHAMTKHVAIQEEVSRQTAEAGRLLNSYNMIVKGEGGDRVRAIKALADVQGGSIADAAGIIADMDTTSGIGKAAADAIKPTFGDKAVEVWINGLLSGPQTHAVNMLSNSLVSLWSIPEHLTAATIGAFRSGKDKVFFREAAARTFGLAEGGREGAIAFWKAIKNPDDVPMAWGAKVEGRPNAMGTGPVGQFVNIPGRFLGAEDRLFQAIGYRQELNTLAMRDGLKEGLGGRELAEHIQQIKNNPPEALKSGAIDAARYQTFTNPTGELATAMSKFANNHPIARFMFPFIKTPTNILKYSIDRTPMGVFAQRYKEAVAKGGPAADLARARLTLSSSMSAGVMGLALDGTITGGGPSDPTERAIWRETHQPYSIKIGDEWHSYQRLEPLGTLFGIASDMASAYRRSDVTEEEKANIAAQLTVSVAKNLTSKTWLKGLSDTFEMLGDPDRHGRKWINGYLGTVVPAAVAQVARTEDPYLKDARTALETIQARTPWTNENVADRITVFGEKIMLEGGVGPDIASPIWTSSVKEHPLATEMLRLGKDALVSKPSRKIKGIKVEGKDYMEYAMEAGRFSTKMTSAFINTPGYQNLPDHMKAERLKQVFHAGRKVITDLHAIKLDIHQKKAAKTIEEAQK